jgi:hypothetical protein
MEGSNMEKPIGTFQCVACNEIWDGSKLIQDPKTIGDNWTCGDPFCGANVVKISDDPKKDSNPK